MTTSSAPPGAALGFEEMQHLFERYGEAWASRDAAAIAPFHAEDGIFHLHAAAPEVRGREMIEAAGGRIEIDAVDVITVEHGLLTAKHTYVDWAAGLQQLGLS